MSTEVDLEQEEMLGALHDVLLTLAERLPEQSLVGARQLLGVGLAEDAARSVLEAVLEFDVGLATAERDLLALAAPGGQQEGDRISGIRVSDEVEERVPDLMPDAHVETDADRALLTALDANEGSRGAWCADVRPARDAATAVRTIRVVQIDVTDGTGAELAVIAGELQALLMQHGVVDPAVDVVEADGWLPPRADSVIAGGTRIWPRAAAEPGAR